MITEHIHSDIWIKDVEELAKKRNFPSSSAKLCGLFADGLCTEATCHATLHDNIARPCVFWGSQCDNSRSIGLQRADSCEQSKYEIIEHLIPFNKFGKMISIW